MQKTRSITIELPEKACDTLERLAEKDFITLENFLQQRVSEFIQFVKAAHPAKAEHHEPNSVGTYL